MSNYQYFIEKKNMFKVTELNKKKEKPLWWFFFFILLTVNLDIFM
jgi:hypothetical protein